jgi:UDP-N-acetylmuramoyl-L-alanyl-D-glutamate--2,6-diaminopimelate ligase
MMTHRKLYSLLGYDPDAGPAFDFDAVTENSRKVRPGALFVAVQGTKSSGYAYAEAAVQAGAVAILGNRPDLKVLAGVPHIFSSHPRRTLGLLAHALQGDPSKSMKVIGVTGTNGKSSTIFLIQAILGQGGHRCAKFGTLGYDVGGELLPADLTTPFPEQLAEAFAKARDHGMSHVAMETSSHALEQERVAGIDFDVAAFTNLTQDHLDYHKTMEAYRAAKLKLVESLEGEGKFTVINLDDPSAQHFVAASRVPCITFGREADCQAVKVRAGLKETAFDLRTPWGNAAVEMRLLGRHNVANALCAATVCGGLGVPVDTIAAGINALAAVPGRFEPVDACQDFQVVVDYAHTDDALRNVLEAARQLCKGTIIVVFGCGGDRDKGKRPKMARAAAECADFTVITSDNPRTEDAHRILLDIEVGMQSAGKKKETDYWVIEDRAEAIAAGIARARSGDLVLIAGKGHEDYQIVGTEKRHFDDRETARAILEAR